MEHNKQLYEHLFQAIWEQLGSGPARTEENGITWVCFGLLYVSSFIFGLASTVVALLGVAVLVTYSPQNGVILLVIAFLVSPLGLPMAAAWLVSKVQDLRYAIQDAVYG